MKFKIKSETLLKGLTIVSKAIPSKSSIAILENVHFDLKGQLLRVTGSDAEITLRHVMQTTEATEDGTVCINGSYLVELLRTLTKCEVSISHNPGDPTVTCDWGSGKSTLPAFDAKDYPTIKTPAKTGNSISFKEKTLSDGLAKTINTTSNDTNKPALTGILIEITPEGTNIVSTNSNQLSCFTDKDASNGTPLSMIISKKTASVLKGLIEKDGEVTVKFDGNNAKFKTGNTELICALINYKYPNYHKVIEGSDKNEKSVELNKDAFLDTIKRIATCTDKVSSCIKFQINNGLITVTGMDAKTSVSAKEKFKCDYTGDKLTIGFKSSAIITLLESMKSGIIEMKLLDAKKAALVIPSEKNQEKENFKGVLMPLAI